MKHPQPDAIHYLVVPFRDVAQSKRRPAVIDTVNADGTVTVFPIYTKPGRNRIPIRATFETGLRHESSIDPSRRVTVPLRAVGTRIGNLPYDPTLLDQLAAG